MVVSIVPLTDGRFVFAQMESDPRGIRVAVPSGASWLNVRGLGPQLMVHGEQGLRFAWTPRMVLDAARKGQKGFRIVQTAKV